MYYENDTLWACLSAVLIPEVLLHSVLQLSIIETTQPPGLGVKKVVDVHKVSDVIGKNRDNIFWKNDKFLHKIPFR